MGARTHRDQSGLTLVELMVVMVIFGIVGGFVVRSVVTATNVAARGESRINAINDLERGLERVGRELRVADPLVIDAAGDYDSSLSATIFRDGDRFVYDFYLVDVGDRAELRQDVARYDGGTGALISDRAGLFIEDIANLETGTELFTYYAPDPATGQMAELDCTSLTADACRALHLTAAQVEVRMQKVLPRGDDPLEVASTYNIRSTRYNG